MHSACDSHLYFCWDPAELGSRTQRATNQSNSLSLMVYAFTVKKILKQQMRFGATDSYRHVYKLKQCFKIIVANHCTVLMGWVRKQLGIIILKYTVGLPGSHTDRRQSTPHPQPSQGTEQQKHSSKACPADIHSVCEHVTCSWTSHFTSFCQQLLQVHVWEVPNSTEPRTGAVTAGLQVIWSHSDSVLTFGLLNLPANIWYNLTTTSYAA